MPGDRTKEASSYYSDSLNHGPLPSRSRVKEVAVALANPSDCPWHTAAAGYARQCRYRKVVESLCKDRLGVVKATASVVEIEEKIGAGQVEQLIQQVAARFCLAPLRREYPCGSQCSVLRTDPILLVFCRRKMSSSSSQRSSKRVCGNRMRARLRRNSTWISNGAHTPLNFRTRRLVALERPRRMAGRNWCEAWVRTCGQPV